MRRCAVCASTAPRALITPIKYHLSPPLQDMDVLHRNISEALRMHPPLLMVMRYAKQPFE